MEKKLRNITHIVEMELTENPETRTDDKLLILNVLNRLGVDTTRPYSELSAEGALNSTESITRARRKVQELHPELIDEVTYNHRKKKEFDYIKYAVEN